MAEVKIKICGLVRPRDAEYLNEAMPDYAGFVFAESRRRINRRDAARLRQILDPAIKTVGVFVNEPLENVAEFISDKVISIAQLHGGEDESYISALKAASGAEIIKVLRAGGVFNAGSWEDSRADYLMLDGGAGTGKPFDWSKLAPPRKRWFLAGGLNLSNIKAALALFPYCADISSGAETDGFKDREKIIALVKAVRGGPNGIHT